MAAPNTFWFDPSSGLYKSQKGMHTWAPDGSGWCPIKKVWVWFAGAWQLNWSPTLDPGSVSKSQIQGCSGHIPQYTYNVTFSNPSFPYVRYYIHWYKNTTYVSSTYGSLNASGAASIGYSTIADNDNVAAVAGVYWLSDGPPAPAATLAYTDGEYFSYYQACGRPS